MDFLHYLAQIEGGEFATLMVAIFGAFGALLVGFYTFSNKQMKEARSEREDNLESFSRIINKLDKTLQKNTEAHKEVAKAVTRQANESKERNGHLAEISKENSEQLVKGQAAIMQALKEIQK